MRNITIMNNQEWLDNEYPESLKEESEELEDYRVDYTLCPNCNETFSNKEEFCPFCGFDCRN